MHAGWVDLAGFHRWRASYEAAAILEGETPPPALVELAKNARAVAASTTPRAVASAKLLRDDNLVFSQMLCELELRPMNLGRVKLPLALWALTFAFRKTLATPEEETRAHDAAVMLEQLAHDGELVAVTHHAFRGLLREVLVARGWSGAAGRRAHWSVWTLRKA